jgi:hypothetical protein
MHGGAFTGEIAAGARFSRIFALYGTAFLGHAPSPAYRLMSGYDIKGGEVSLAMYSCEASLSLSRILELDLSVGLAHLGHDIDCVPPDGFQCHTESVSSWGVGYRLGMAGPIPVGAIRIAPFVEWRAAALGDIVASGEKSRGWDASVFGAGLQVSD